MGKHCCYATCNSDSRYSHKPHMEGVFFIPFPKPHLQEKKCMKWIHACARVGFGPACITKDTYICSKHFVGGKGPTEVDPDPLPATASSQKLKQLNKKRKQPRPRENVPPKKKLYVSSATTAGESLDINTHEVESQAQCCVCHIVEKTESPTQTETVVTESTGVQTEYDKYLLGTKVENMILRNEMRLSNNDKNNSTGQELPLLDLNSVKDNDKKMRFFTGSTFIQFTALFTFLGDAVYNLNYWDGSRTASMEKNANKSHRHTKPIDELFICLSRMRRGYCMFALSHMCKQSVTSIRTIFTTWLQLLYCHFNDIRHLMFPDRVILRKYMPRNFRCFKNFRCSIDCTEFFVQMPRDFAQQGNLYSNYKNHHTYKCLIAVAPNGAATFISDLYEGAISDKDIFAKCGILDYINPGDLILADRGFTVQDLLNQKQADLNIPAFLKGRTKLTAKEELLKRKIAKARIHVERFNERLKKFRLVAGCIPLAVSHLPNQAVFVASCLVNFQQPLAK